jgi:NTP pyrophosphatase (non-canonical NTP hydrolase)
MEISEIQKQIEETVDILDQKFKCKHTPEITLIHLMEEIGELASQINNPNMRNKPIDMANLEEELADVLILAVKLASCYNIDMEKAIKNKIEMLKKRHNL